MANPYQSGVWKDNRLKAFHKQHTSFMEIFPLKMERSKCTMYTVKIRVVNDKKSSVMTGGTIARSKMIDAISQGLPTLCLFLSYLFSIYEV